MFWYKKLSILSNRRNFFCAAGVMLLATSAFMASNAFAEVLSFSIINEKFQPPNTNADAPRLERLRKSFFLVPPIKGAS